MRAPSSSLEGRDYVSLHVQQGPLRRGSSTLPEPSHSQHRRRKPQISCALSLPGLERDLWNTLNHSVRTHSRYFWTYEETFIEQFSIMYSINEKVTKRKEKKILLPLGCHNYLLLFIQWVHLQISFCTNKDSVLM